MLLGSSTRSRVAAVFACALIVFLLAPALMHAAALSEAPAWSPLKVRAAFPSGEPQPPELTSKAALVVDAESGEVLFSKNADDRLSMASTTKIMTAIVVLESLDLDTRVVVSRNAHAQRGSVVGLHYLDSVTVERLLHWLLVFSGNDAAVALAEKTAGSESKFVAKMNDKAQQMGLVDTHFTNANGLDETGHYSSCSDLAAMARYALKLDRFRSIVRTYEYSLPHPSSYTPQEPHNSNALLAKYDWIDGVKTGSTPLAGYCMVASGTRNGVSLIVVQMGAKDDATRWTDVEALFRYGYQSYPAMTLAQSGRLLAQVPVGDPLGQVVELVPKDSLVCRLSKSEEVTGTISWSRGLTLPIRAGEVLGTVEFALDGESVGETEIMARCAVYAPNARRMVLRARSWYLPEFSLNERVSR